MLAFLELPLEVVQVEQVHHSILKNLYVDNSFFSILIKIIFFKTKTAQNVNLCTTVFKILKQVPVLTVFDKDFDKYLQHTFYRRQC